MSETDEKYTPPKEGPQDPEGDDAGKVGVKLAHPLSKSALKRLYLPKDTRAGVNDVVVVTPDQAQSLIGAGFVQVDTKDPVAVATLIKGAEAQSTDVDPSGT